MSQVEPSPFASGDSTATVTEVASQAPTTTRTIADLVDDAGFLSSRVGLHVQDATELQSEASQLHTDALRELMRSRADERAAEPLAELLTCLSERGFAWRDVARWAGVSVPALRKWRRGGTATGENRLKVAEMVALCEVIEEKAPNITDIASWLEVPLLGDVPVCGLDLLVADRNDLVFRRALHHDAAPESILDEFEPDWRSVYRGEFEVFEADDGMLGLRVRESDA